jgi:PKHD-type hydroxylase
VNFDKFQLSLDAFDGLQYTKYGVEQHYDWHIDAIERPQHPALHRKLSVAIMLSDPSEYESGELVLNVGGNPANAVTLKQSKGDVIFFYSFVPHKVEPVTSGERVSLVTWMLGAKLC